MKSAEKKTTDKMQINETQMWNFIYLMQLPLGMGPGEEKIHDVDWELMYRLARKHNVVALGYAAVNGYTGQIPVPEALKKKWKRDSAQSTMQCLYQQAAQEELEDSMSREKIPAIFLKGAVLRGLYPSPELRSMADIDLLIREEDAGRAAKIMRELQYQVHSQNSRNEDVYCREPKVTVEIHRQLFWKEQTWNVYFRTVWDRAAEISDSIYIKSMAVQDFYIHLLGHLIHHMENGGLGIKAFLDLILFYEKYKQQLCGAEMKKLLEKFQFTEFENNLRKLLEDWKSGEQRDSLTAEWSEYIVKCGAYGNAENFIIRNTAMNKNITRGSKKQKIHYTLRRLFPTYEEMCNMYPKAAKGRYTYPWFCIRRIWKNGIMRHRIIRRELQTVKQMDTVKIDKLNKLYRKTGMPEGK